MVLDKTRPDNPHFTNANIMPKDMIELSAVFTDSYTTQATSQRQLVKEIPPFWEKKFHNRKKIHYHWLLDSFVLQPVDRSI
jgi:hypothetical protein